MTAAAIAAMDKPSDILIRKLQERQAEAGLTEQKFADFLGVNKATWILIRQGNTKPGLKFIAAVVRAYPKQLDEEVMAFLKEEPGLMELWSQPVPA